MPGPIGKRDEERRRRNAPVIPTVKVDLDELIQGEVEVPQPNPNWHPIAAQQYDALVHSGQVIFYEPSDWATAYTLCELLDRELKPKEVKVGERDVVDVTVGEDGEQRIVVGGKDYVFELKETTISAASLKVFLSGMASLMATEGDRRRLHIELNRKAAADAVAGKDSNVVSITQNRESLFEKKA